MLLNPFQIVLLNLKYLEHPLLEHINFRLQQVNLHLLPLNPLFKFGYQLVLLDGQTFNPLAKQVSLLLDLSDHLASFLHNDVVRAICLVLSGRELNIKVREHKPCNLMDQCFGPVLDLNQLRH